MNCVPLNGGLVRVELATPDQVGVVAGALGLGDGLVGVVLMYGCGASGGGLKAPLALQPGGAEELVGKEMTPKAEGAKEKAPEDGVRIPVYRIKQESTRRRRGRYDKTEVSTWRVCFGFAEVLLPESVASEYLIHLIWKQAKEFGAGALTEAIRRSMPGGGDERSQLAREIVHGREGIADEAETARGRVGDVDERDEIWDKRQIAECLRRVKELLGELGEHEAAGDRASGAYQLLRGKLEEQQDLLRANAREAKGRWVPKEYRMGTFGEKADAIRKQFRRLLDGYLRQSCRPLFDHLNDKEVLRYGVKNCYRPKPRINWEFEFKEMKKGQ
jgi:hypothetical protein